MTKHSRSGFKAVAGIALLAACSLFLPAQAGAQPVALIEDEPGGPVYVAGDLLIQVKPNATDADLRDVTQRGALTRLVKHIQTDAMKAANHPGVSHMWTGLPVRQAIAALKNHPAVEFAEPNWVYSHQDTPPPSDSYFGNGSLWGMYGDGSSPANQFGSQAAEAWAAGYTGDSLNPVVVGVIDEGIQFTHRDLDANIWTNPYDPLDGVDNDGNGYVDDIHGWNCIDNNNIIYTAGQDAHGTHVSGTIGAEANNTIGVVGINWNVTIISGKFLGPKGGTTADAIEAVDYFTGLKIAHPKMNLVALNNSWGGGGFSQALLDAIVRAAKSNILFVAAAGNGDFLGRAIDTDSSPGYPACYNTTVGAGYDSVISVTAIDSAGNKASWANYGATTVDLGAPGVGIWSTVPTDTYASYSGTSMATPHVTGAAALYASTHPNASAATIKSALLTSTLSTDSLASRTLTGGRLNLSTVIGPPVPPPDNAPPVAGDQTLTTDEDRPVSITLTATDPNNDALTYRVVIPPTSGTLSGTAPTLTYTPNVNYNGTDFFTFVANDGFVDSEAATVTITITPINDPPVANAGPDQTVNDLNNDGELVTLNGSGSSDPEGVALSYEWKEGSTLLGNGAALNHTFAVGVHTVTLTVTDGGASASDTVVVTVNPPEIVVFADSFEVSEWNGLWTEDSQNDWFRSTQRATAGSRSAEVDGSASDASLTSIAINLQGRSKATISFDWLIESGLDNGEYLEFRVSLNGGSTWTQKAILRGNVDPENTWRSQTVELTGISQLKLQFRGKMDKPDEDANVDNVRVVAK